MKVRNVIMYGSFAIIAMFIGCAVMKPQTSSASNVIVPQPIPIEYSYPVNSPVLVKIDTFHKKHNPEFQDRLNHLLDRSDKAFNNIDEILSINVEWQKRYMRVADTARSRKKGKDSLYSIVIALRDSTIVFNKRSQQYYEQVKKANHFESKVNTEDKWYKWFMIVCVGGTFLSTIVTWIIKDKTPA